MRAGDVVKHEPSGEEWLLGRVYNGFVYPCGWPPCRAEAKDCTLVHECTDEDHAKMVAKWAIKRGLEHGDERQGPNDFYRPNTATASSGNTEEK